MGISAIVTSLAAITFIIIGLWLSSYAEAVFGKYILISGAGMVLISICFTVGLFQLKNGNSRGKIWPILASAGLVITIGFSAFITLTSSHGWKFTSLTLLLSLFIIVPFIWLIFYLWTFDKK